MSRLSRPERRRCLWGEVCEFFSFFKRSNHLPMWSQTNSSRFLYGFVFGSSWTFFVLFLDSDIVIFVHRFWCEYCLIRCRNFFSFCFFFGFLFSSAAQQQEELRKLVRQETDTIERNLKKQIQRLSGSMREEMFPFEQFSQQLMGMFPGRSILPVLCFLDYANLFCYAGIIPETIELSDVIRQLCDSDFDFPDEFKQLRNRYQIQCSSPAEIKQTNDRDPGLQIDQLVKAYDSLVLLPDETPSPPVSPHSFGALCLDLLPAPHSRPLQPTLSLHEVVDQLEKHMAQLRSSIQNSSRVPPPARPAFSTPNLVVLVEITNADLTASENIAVEKGCQLERQIAWFLFRPAPHRLYPRAIFLYAPSSRFNVSCKGDFYSMNFGHFFTRFFDRYRNCFPLLETYFRKQLFVPLITKHTEIWTVHWTSPLDLL